MAQLDAGAAAPHRGRRRTHRPPHLRHGRLRAKRRSDNRRHRAIRHTARPLDARPRHAQPLNHAAATTYRGDVYVVGGYAGASGLTNEVATLYRYDPQRDRWRKLASMPTARGALTAGVIRHRLYAAGGAGSHHAGALPTLEVFDLRTRRWRTGPDMPTAREHLPAPSPAGASTRSPAA